MLLRNRTHIAILLTALVTALIAVGSASAAPLSPDSFGVNANYGLTDVSLATTYGAQLVRYPVTPSMDTDKIVRWAASNDLRLYPMMGLDVQLTPSGAATAMAQFVTSFAQRYGRGGTFWQQNPQLPYLPVESYEIGNEPNIWLSFVADNTHLHWDLTDGGPAAYAQVYEASRAALHAVDPLAQAVVGGLADSGNDGVDLQSDEEWLAALTPGTVDAVGFHPYTYPVSFSLMYADTEGLRQWMDANGMQNVPIDINEVGACDPLPQDIYNVVGCSPSISSADWGTFAADFTEWSVCSSALNVESMQPEYWGDLPTTDENAILALVSSEGTLTPYGTDYLNEVRTLTTTGCSLANTSSPTVSGDPVAGQVLSATAGSWSPAGPSVSYQWESCNSADLCGYIPGATSATYQAQPSDVGSTLLVSVTASGPAGDVSAWSTPTGVVSAAPSPVGSGPPPSTTPPWVPPPGGGSTPPIAVVASMGLHIVSAHPHAGQLTVVVRVTPGSRRVTVVAKKGSHKVHLRLSHHNRINTLLTFTARLAGGRWRVTVACPPPAGYARPAVQSRTVTVRG